MLSRVAESLYWVARYIERAEDVTRLLDVNFHALLDGEVADRGASWQQLVAVLGDDGAYLEHHEDYTAESVSNWVLWHRGNTNAVSTCIELARENARSVREQISGEMWEAINKLFLLVRGGPHPAAGELHSLFGELRSYAHLFQGAADATMEHGEAYEFIRLGLHLERAEKTARIVGARYPGVAALDETTRSGRARSATCCARAARSRRTCASTERRSSRCRSRRSSSARPTRRAPCGTASSTASTRSSGSGATTARRAGCSDGWRPSSSSTSRSTSRGRRSRAAMTQLLAGINSVGESVTKTYFASRAVPIAAITAQEVQQQQCG